jgi:hypothetical protein
MNATVAIVRRLSLGAAVLCVPAVALASFDGSGTISQNAYSNGLGGEFTLTPVSGFVGVTGLAADLSATAFQTFCLEVNENFAPGTTYDLCISTSAVAGGSGGPSLALDPRVAFLYFNFRLGTLAGYDYSVAGRQASAGSLQQAIWFIQGNQPGGANNAFVTLADTAVGSGGWIGLGDVRVLNVVGANGALNQDQLTIIPAPGAAAVLGLGVLLAGRRRR